jgi:hypothetical protein
MKGFTAGAIAGIVALGVMPGVAQAHSRVALSVSIVSYPKVAQPGRPLVYRVEVRNEGQGEGVPPTLRVRLPDGVQMLSTDVTECKLAEGTNDVVCPPKGVLKAGGTGALTVACTVKAHARGKLRAVADLGRETAHVVTDVDGGADLALRFESDGSPRSARAGRRGVRIRALVRNHGPRTVNDAQVFVRAEKARFVRAEGARCGSSSGYLDCRVPEVKRGEVARFQLVYRPKERDAVAHGVVYSAKFGDPHPGNDNARSRLR